MQKYMPFLTSLPEFAKYAANMKGFEQIMRIPAVWRIMPIELFRPIWDVQEAH